MANSHSDIFDVIGSLDSVDDHTIFDVLRGRLRIPRLAPDSELASFARRRGPLLIEDRSEAPYLTLPDDPDGILAAFSAKKRYKLKRGLSGLEKLGQIEFEDHDETPECRCETFEEILRLEASTWKGRLGTAILSDERSQIFYRRLARLAADRGWLRLSTLRLDSRLIGAHISLDFLGRRFLLKTTYDESPALESYSPGFTLAWLVLEECVRRGLSGYEFLGRAEPWKLRWTDTTSPRMSVISFPESPGGIGQFWLYAGGKHVRRRLDRGRQRVNRTVGSLRKARG